MKKYLSIVIIGLTIIVASIVLGIYIWRGLSPTLVEALGYSKKDILVIVNMDDIGLHSDVTNASFDALRFGMAKSGSIMVPCPDFERTIDLLKKNPVMDIGIHLTLTCEWGEKYPWSPILPKNRVPSLYNSKGIMWPDLNSFILHANIQEAIWEMDAQIQKLIKSAIMPSHIDGHMSFYYTDDKLFKGAMELSRKYKIPMRVWRQRRYRLPLFPNNLPYLQKMGFVFPNSSNGFYTIEGEEQNPSLRAKSYLDYLKKLKPGIHEIITHFAFQSGPLMDLIGNQNVSIRYNDYKVWTDSTTKTLTEKIGIKFINFKQLQELQAKKINNEGK